MEVSCFWVLWLATTSESARIKHRLCCCHAVHPPWPTRKFENGRTVTFFSLKRGKGLEEENVGADALSQCASPQLGGPCCTWHSTAHHARAKTMNRVHQNTSFEFGPSWWHKIQALLQRFVEGCSPLVGMLLCWPTVEQSKPCCKGWLICGVFEKLWLLASVAPAPSEPESCILGLLQIGDHVSTISRKHKEINEMAWLTQTYSHFVSYSPVVDMVIFISLIEFSSRQTS